MTKKLPRDENGKTIPPRPKPVRFTREDMILSQSFEDIKEKDNLKALSEILDRLCVAKRSLNGQITSEELNAADIKEIHDLATTGAQRDDIVRVMALGSKFVWTGLADIAYQSGQARMQQRLRCLLLRSADRGNHTVLVYLARLMLPEARALEFKKLHSGREGQLSAIHQPKAGIIFDDEGEVHASIEQLAAELAELGIELPADGSPMDWEIPEDDGIIIEDGKVIVAGLEKMRKEKEAERLAEEEDKAAKRKARGKPQVHSKKYREKKREIELAKAVGESGK